MNHTPRLQLALDEPNLQDALNVLQATHDIIDIIEVGTILCLAEGMHAIREIRQQYSRHTIIGDVRIVRAGAKIANMVLDAGANWVTVVAEAPLTTLEATLEIAESVNGQVQIEMSEMLDIQQAYQWKELGIRQVIYHSTAEVSSSGPGHWRTEALDIVKQLCDMSFDVTVTGGITPETVSMFAELPISIIIAGRSIWNSENPRQSALAMKEAIQQVYG